MKEVKAFKKNNIKISTKESWYIFFIVLLILTIAFLSFIYFNNPYIPHSSKNSISAEIGTDITIDITDCGGFSKTLTLNGMLMPEFDIEQNVFLRLNASSQNCKARAKVFMFDNNGKYVSLNSTFTSDWLSNEDGYYYYNGIISPSLVLKFVKSIQTPNITLYSGNQYLVYITLETLPQSSNPDNIWLNNL